MIKSNKIILFCSDLHIPYHHQDTFEFLKAVKKKYKPTRVISVGDEVDYHSLSFHDSDPDLMSPGDELQRALAYLSQLYKIFPQMDLVDSNHGSMVYRRQKAHGIPRHCIKSYNEILNAPKTWKWHQTLTIKLPNKQELFVCHGMKKNGIKLAESMGMNTVQGHFHSDFNIQYSSSPSQLIWSMQVGCSIDDKSLAFAYNKVTPQRPIIGHGIVIDGIPKLLPMILDKSGRWTGFVP